MGLNSLWTNAFEGTETVDAVMREDAPVTDTVEVSEHIDAPAATVYDLVSDLPRMGQWSPEARGGRWLDGAAKPQQGARFRGNNRSGWRRWSTTVEVTDAERGNRFAFHVTLGPVAISDWSYDFAPSATGTTVTERWADRRPGWMRALSGPVMGVSDRGGHNRANMQQTLQALKQAAEQQ
jgi:uncharacterized protein YndB with AHSA1/START domain